MKTLLDLYIRRPLFSLQKMSLIRIATTLCNNPELLGLIRISRFHIDYTYKICARKGPEWAKVLALWNRMVYQVCNCRKITVRIMELLWPICYKITIWRSLYTPSIDSRFLRHFYWTDQGRIDSIRTAKYIFGNNNISLRNRFILACNLCLDNEIRKMWNEMSNNDKVYFRGENCSIFRPLLLFWVHTIDGSDNSARRFKKDACVCALENGLLESMKYLLGTYSKVPKKRLAYLYMEKFATKLRICQRLEEDELDIAYFLFFEMCYNSREVISASSPLVLILLLHFSEREHFLKTLEQKLKFSPYDVVMTLLNSMFFNYHLEIVKDDDYRKIFVHIWRKIPASMKREIAETSAGAEFITYLIRDNFPFLLRKEAFKKIHKLASSDTNLRFSGTPFGFHRDKWDFLHFLIEEEVAKLSTLKRFRFDMILDFNIRFSNKAAWNRVLRFVRQVKSKSHQQKE